MKKIFFALIVFSSVGSADPRVVLHTVAGDMLILLTPKLAPLHVAQFLKLVKLGVYDSTHFFRLEPNFVLQLASAQERLTPLTPQQSAAIVKIPGEFNPQKHVFGALSMARFDNDENSAETSFSILLNSAPHLDGKYTVFGHVERGIDALVELAKTPTDSKTHPRARLTILGAEAIESPAGLDALRWIPAQSVSVPAADTGGDGGLLPSSTRVVCCGLLAMLAISVAAALLASNLSVSQLVSLHLLQALVGAFLVLVLLLPVTNQAPWIGAGLFFGLVGVFKLLGRFERT